MPHTSFAVLGNYIRSPIGSDRISEPLLPPSSRGDRVSARVRSLLIGPPGLGEARIGAERNARARARTHARCDASHSARAPRAPAGRGRPLARARAPPRATGRLGGGRAGRRRGVRRRSRPGVAPPSRAGRAMDGSAFAPALPDGVAETGGDDAAASAQTAVEGDDIIARSQVNSRACKRPSGTAQAAVARRARRDPLRGARGSKGAGSRPRAGC
jgi:hypothetical protein